MKQDRDTLHIERPLPTQTHYTGSFTRAGGLCSELHPHGGGSAGTGQQGRGWVRGGGRTTTTVKVAAHQGNSRPTANLGLPRTTTGPPFPGQDRSPVRFGDISQLEPQTTLPCPVCSETQTLGPRDQVCGVTGKSGQRLFRE